MSDFTPLREAVDTLASHAHPLDFGDLERRAIRRGRRRIALVATAGVAAVILTVGIAEDALSGGEHAQGPVHQPSPSSSETTATGAGWTPERIRAEGAPRGDVFDYGLGPAPSGLDAELYCVGEEACDEFPPDLEGRTGHVALEMTKGGQSVLFEVRGRPWARYFGDDSILVEDGFGQAVRFRLLNADGTAVQLRMVSDSAPAAPGPDVVLIQDLDRARDFQVGPDGPGIHPYLVDDRAGTIRPLDVPDGIEQWGPNVDEFLWGINGCRVIWQGSDGSFDHHDVSCRNPRLTDLPGDYWKDGLDAWAAPGRMVLLEHNADGDPLTVHVSVDGGATWQRIEIEDRNWDGTTAMVKAALADALAQVG